MAIESRESKPEGTAAGAATFAILGGDFVDVLALFVRTIPLYPDGHGRVVAVSDRLQETAAAQREPVVVEVADRGLIIDGQERAQLSPGLKALREALIATAVVRVTFQPSAPASSYVVFARSLQRNARRATTGHLSFVDLWMAQIPGIEVSELTFRTAGYANGAAEAKSADDALAVLGASGGVGRVDSSASLVAAIDARLGSGGEDAAPIIEAKPTRMKLRRVETVARDLRELALDEPGLAEALIDLERRLLADGAEGSPCGADVLEHLVRALPIEARLDPAKGVVAIRLIVERMLASLSESAPGDESVDLPTRFFQTMQRVFPKRVRGPDAGPTTPSVDVPASLPHTSALDEVSFLDDAVLAELCGPSTDGAYPTPELVVTDGVAEPSGLLLHSLLEEPAGERHDELRRRLLAAYAARPATAPPPCILTHLSELIAAPAEARDMERIARLAEIVDETGIEFGGGAASISLDLAAALFPVAFGAYLRGGGRAGALARRVGHDAVLAAADRICAPGGALTGTTLDRILAERTLDVLPFVEALLVAVPSSRPRVARALRALDIKSLAAIALRVVPEERFTGPFLRELCADAFAGVDSQQLVAEAARALATVVLDREGVLDLTTRNYAAAALGSFPPALATSPLRAIAARKLIGAAPKELRRTASAILQRFAHAAAEARPVP